MLGKNRDICLFNLTVKIIELTKKVLKKINKIYFQKKINRV